VSECPWLKLTPSFDACLAPDEDGVICNTHKGRDHAETCHRYQRARADVAELEVVRLTDELERIRTVARGLAVLLQRWLARASELEGVMVMAHVHGMRVSPTTIGDDTRAALANLPEEPPCQSQSAGAITSGEPASAEATSCAIE
jgi:hypothetical protein